MEILSHHIHVCNDLWMLENNAFGSCVLQGLIHQGQDGLLRLQSYLHGIKTPQGAESMCFGHFLKAKSWTTVSLQYNYPHSDEVLSQQ